MFIVVEGSDGVGKGTQVRLLVEWLKSLGLDIWETREPTDGIYGREIRQILNKQKPMPSAEDFQKLFVSDRQEHQTAIAKALRQGKTVVCDRYHYSSLAYGAAGGADISYLREVGSGFIKPDLVVWLNLDSEAARARMESRGVLDTLDDDLIFQERLQTEYRKLMSEFPEIVEVDASGMPEEVQARVRQVLTERLGLR